MRVLELGGGNGYQASVIASWGCETVSVEIRSRPPEPSFHPLIDYDGRNLPFRKDCFDRVYSSNVLEHITVSELAGVFAELRRVLRAGGLIIHILPSTQWRFWTMITYYVTFWRKVAADLTGDKRQPRVHQRCAGAAPAARASLARRVFKFLRKALIEPAHGEYSSALAELYYFSRRRWRNLFERSSFEIVFEGDNGLFYTGYGILPQLSIARRRTLARILGPSCSVFVMRGADGSGACKPGTIDREPDQ